MATFISLCVAGRVRICGGDADLGSRCFFGCRCYRYVNLLAVPAVLTLAVLVLPMPQRAKELVRGAVQKVLFHEVRGGRGLGCVWALAEKQGMTVCWWGRSMSASR